MTRVLVTRHPRQRTDPSGDQGPPTENLSEDQRLGAQRRAAVALLPPVLGGAPSQPLKLGRTTRVIQPAQRAALAVRDGGWVVPGRDRPLAGGEAHHLVHWRQGGPTDRSDLALVCRTHHRAVMRAAGG